MSGLALVVTAPLLAGIAGAIAVTSGRPIFFTQERMGLDGRVFRMIKFRSMIHGAEDEKFCALARRYSEALRSARLELVRACGHAAHLEQPETFGEIARAFYAQVDAATTGSEKEER